MAHENNPNFTLNDYSYLVIVTNLTFSLPINIIKDYFDQIIRLFISRFSYVQSRFKRVYCNQLVW